MGPPEPTPLPKGILKNSSTVYAEVASYTTLPPDKVHQYWRVYTTTNKKLKDPTARRLENFWWHVWGSDRSKLSGRVLARIFQDISLGPTVVPLKGPPNRWEGPDASPLNIELIVAHLQKDLKPSGKSAVRSFSSALHSYQLPPSLTKVGSSSTSIAKNTTRFVSPQESADEVGVESGAPSLGSTLKNDFDGAGHALVSNRANLQAGDLFQRPQSPTDSHELASTSSAVRKKTVRDRESNLRVRQVRNRGQPEVYSQSKRTGTTTPCSGTLAQNDQKASSKLSTREKIVLGKQPAIRRSQTSNLPARPGVPSTAKPKCSLFTEAISSTSNVAAQGTIIDQAGSTNNPTQIPASNSTKDEMKSHGRSSISPLVEARSTPTQPSSSASLPLGRTKSQLTLLLERAKARSRG